MELHPGQIITAPFLPAPAEVKKFEARKGYYRLEALLRDGSNQIFGIIIPVKMNSLANLLLWKDYLSGRS